MKKGFTLIEITIVLSVLLMMFILSKDVIRNIYIDREIKKEQKNISFLLYKYILDPNTGYVSNSNVNCGNYSFNDISAYRIKDCIGGINDSYFKINDTSTCTAVTDDKIGLCSSFSSNKVVNYDIHIEENESNTDELYFYIDASKISYPINDEYEIAKFEENLYGSLMKDFAPLLIESYREADWDKSSPKTGATNSSTLAAKFNLNGATNKNSDGKFLYIIKKL